MAELHETYDEAEKLKGEGKLEEAVSKHQEVLTADPNYSLSHFALAVLYGMLNDHKKAVEHGEQAAQLEPSDSFSYTALSVTYQRAFEATRDMQLVELAEHAKERAAQLRVR